MDKVIVDLRTKENDNTAQYKAKNDIATILASKGFRCIPYYFYESKLKKLLSVYKLIYQLRKIHSGYLFYQFPLGSKQVDKLVLSKLSKNKKIKKVAIIHDLESLRYFSEQNGFKGAEVALLKSFDGLIVHNDVMKGLLKSAGITIPMVSLEVFDYLSRNTLVKPAEARKIAFAGNLGKSTFLGKLAVKTQFNAYGPNRLNKYPDNISYQGSFTPDELIGKMDESFGLIWDGNQIDTCAGIYGNYEKFNSPHKLSLYLAAGMPVIVWQDSAISKFVAKNDLGLAIDSLVEIDDLMEKISIDRYAEMKTNALAMAKKIRNGYFTERAVSKMIRIFTDVGSESRSD
ncbi:MAG: sugar transferase [Lactobacillus sp.]